MSDNDNFTSHITITSTDRVNVMELAKAVAAFGVVTSVSCKQRDTWDD